MILVKRGIEGRINAFGTKRYFQLSLAVGIPIIQLDTEMTLVTTLSSFGNFDQC
jgi:hypothetical protein